MSTLTATIIVQNLVSPFLKYPGIKYITQPRLAVTKSIGEHGFAMVLDIKEDAGSPRENIINTVLWDVGSLNCTILHNFQAWGRSFSDVKCIALSHGHYDHAAALVKVLEEIGHTIEIHAHPDACTTRYFSRSAKFRYENLLGKSVDSVKDSVEKGEIFKSPGLVSSTLQKIGGSLVLSKDPTNLFEDANYKIWTTGQVPRVVPDEDFKSFVYDKAGVLENDLILDDQSLVIERKQQNDVVVLLGCCHAGLLNTMKFVESRITSRISIVIGGTHMESASTKRLNTTLQFLRERVPIDLFPVHCSGAEFPLSIKHLGVGGLRAFDASVFTQFLL